MAVMTYLGLFLMLFSTTLYAITPLDIKHKRETVTLDYFLEACTVIGETSGGMIPHFDCESYLYGVLDGYSAVREQLPVKERACFPKAIAPWQVYELMQKQIVVDGHKPAVQVILESLRTKYPC